MGTVGFGLGLSAVMALMVAHIYGPGIALIMFLIWAFITFLIAPTPR